MAPLLFPLPVCLLLLAAGLVLMLRGRRRAWGKAAALGGLVLLIIASFGPLADALVGSLERTYQTHQPGTASAPVRWIVVLGGGIADDPALPANAQLSSASQQRLLEGVRQLHGYPEARLLLSGSGVFSVRTEADAMGEAATWLGVDERRLLLEEASRDTEEQAANVQRYVGTDSFVLVTSAAHMKRAMRLFEQRGLHPIPAPTDFLVKQKQAVDFRSWYPGSDNLQKTTVFVRENLGLLWAVLRGKG